LRTTCGKNLEIIDPGKRNIHEGPDFTCARIRAGRLIWVGNVEIHVCSSDWKNHGHHLNPVYDNVILHVILQYRGEVWNALGNHVFTCIIPFHEQLYNRYKELLGTREWLPCENHISQIPEPIQRTWLSRLCRQRLVLKSQSTYKILMEKQTSREEALFRIISSSMGLPNNSAPFFMLASRIPARMLYEIRDDLIDLEALLFGHSGLIDRGDEPCAYAMHLKSRYCALSRALTTRPLPPYVWHYLRLRPAAFPTIRIALLASLLHCRMPLGPTLLHISSLPELEQLLRVRASPFWDSHYMFEKVAPLSPKYLGIQSVQLLIINAIVPYMEALGRANHQKSYLVRAKDLLLQVKAESNHIIKNWIKFGVSPRDASESQGLIQLHQGYCRQKRCLDCMFGTYILGTAVDEKLQP
jgi:hypothetical protein